MAIASVGTIGTTGAFASANSFTHAVATNALANGDFAILVIVSNNIQTTSGASSDHTGVSATNIVATKLGEWTNGQSAAAAGVTVSAWLLEATGVVNTGSVITMTMSGAITDKVCSGWKMTKAAGMRIRLSTDPATNPIGTVVNLATNHGSASFSGLPSKARLYFRALGKEANTTTALTVSSGFTAITAQRSRNDASAVVVRGEFRINTSTGETSNPTMSGSSDGAGLFIALEEYDPRPVITVQPTDANMLIGELATFSVTATGATGYQWKKAVTSGGGSATPLGSPVNVDFTNAPNPAAVSVTVPANANAWAVAGTYYIGDAGAAVSTVSLAGGTTQNLQAAPSTSHMSGYAAWGKINSPSGSSGSANLTVSRAVGGNYVEGPTCQIQFFQVSNPDDWVRDWNLIAGVSGPLTGSVATESGDIAYAWMGGDSSFTIGSATGWTAVGAQHNFNSDSARVLVADSVVAGGETSLTGPTNTYSTQFLLSIKGGGGTTWENVTEGTGGTTNSYSLDDVQLTDNGTQFRVDVSNADGTTVSNTATLFVSDGKALFRSEITGGVSSPNVNCTVGAPTLVNGDGDLIIIGAGVISGSSSPTIATPSGYDLVDTADGFPLAGVVNTRVSIFKRVAPGAGSSVIFTASAASLWGWSRFSYDNINGADFVAQVAIGHLASSSSPVLPGVTTTEINTVLLTWISQALAQGATQPAGMTLRVNDEAGGIAAADQQIADIGPTGSRTYTLPSACDLVYAVVVIRSLASASGGPAKRLKARVGGAWVAGVLKRWNGSAWVAGVPKARIGSTWE